MKSRIGLFVVVLALLLPGALYAQAGPGPGDDPEFETAPGGGPPPSEARREEVRKKLEAVRMWRLTEELKLDEKTSTKLASFLSSIEEQRRGLIRTNMAAMKELRAVLSAQKPDEGKLKAELDRIEKNQRDMVALREKEINGIKGMLTVEQQARYVVFQQQFRREMRGMIAGARGGQPRNRPGAPPGPPPR